MPDVQRSSLTRVIAVEPDRHDDRVVRFLPLRLGRRAGVQQAVLPLVRPADRDPACFRDLCGRVRRAAARRHRVRPFRRPHRAQEIADVEPRDDGPRDRADRALAGLRDHRRMGADRADRAARVPGLCRRRRMGRRGADGRRARRRQAARLLGELAAGGRSARASPLRRNPRADGRNPDQCRLPPMGLASAVPAFRRAGDRRLVYPQPGDREPDVRGRDRGRSAAEHCPRSTCSASARARCCSAPG